MAKTPVKLKVTEGFRRGVREGRCGGCNHSWLLRAARPQRCPKCQAPFEPKEAA